MLVIPAIDIIDGECVRLTQGDYASKKVYASDPVRVAREFEAQGASMLHLVDLDGAKKGKPLNMALILKIAKSVKIPVEVGGGIRDLETVQKYLQAGIRRVVLGTKATEDQGFLKTCLKQHGPDRIVVGIDARDGRVATDGWQKLSNYSFLDFAKKLKNLGVREIIYTDIVKDGTLTSPNFRAIKKLKDLGLNVVASGGISDRKSLEKLMELRVDGAILGKALYEKKLNLSDVLKFARGASNLTKRIIPCLDVKDGRVVKGINFLNLRDSGDPVELGKRYSEENADELVFLDITASHENRDTMAELVREVAKNVFIPFTVGGGIRSVDEIRRILHHGADKVSLNTSAVANPRLVQDASKYFGAQCIVVAIDAKKVRKEHKVFVKGGREETKLEARTWAKEVEGLGAGEILLTSMDRDGTEAGYDLELLKKITDAVKIPVIASGGAGSLRHLRDALIKGGADAVLAASLFHQGELSIRQAKEYLRNEGLPVRL